MQILLIISIILFLILLLIYFRASKMPDFYLVKQSIEINRSPEDVCAAICDFHIYKQWNVWNKMEADPINEISGAPNTVGHKWSWDGKKIGKGQLEITKIQAPHRVDMLLTFERPMQSVADDWWEIAANGKGGSLVTWSDTGKLPKVTQRLMGPMITRSLTKQFQEGLQNFKALLEK